MTDRKSQLTRAFGRVVWIGVRQPRVPGPGSQAPTAAGAIEALAEVRVDSSGLVGDRHSRDGGKRAVTLVQREHFNVVGSLLGGIVVTAENVRRNLVIEGINLQSLKRGELRVGEVILQGTGDCFPCRRMNDTLGEGGHQTMMGHGGITASVVRPGTIRLGDRVAAVATAARPATSAGD